MGETEISENTTNHGGTQQGGTGANDTGRGGEGQTGQYIHEGGNHGHHGKGNTQKEKRKAMKRGLTPTLAGAAIVIVAGLIFAGGSTLGGTYVADGGGTYFGDGGGTYVADGGGTYIADGGGTYLGDGGVADGGGTYIA